jgi:hypothetical protein
MGQAEQGSPNRTDKTGQPKLISQNKTGRIGQTKQDWHNRTAMKELLDRAARTGLLGLNGQGRT